MLVLASTFGVVINKHFCQDELKEISLFLDSKRCQPALAPVASCHHQPVSTDTDGIDKSRCCDYQSDFYQVDFQQEAGTTAQVEKLTDVFHPFLIEESDSFDLSVEAVCIRPPPYYSPLIPCPDQPDLQVFLC